MWPLIKFLRGLKKTFLQRVRGTAASEDPTPQLWQLWGAHIRRELRGRRCLHKSSFQPLTQNPVRWETKGNRCLPHFQAGRRWVSTPDERWVKKSLFEI